MQSRQRSYNEHNRKHTVCRNHVVRSQFRFCAQHLPPPAASIETPVGVDTAVRVNGSWMAVTGGDDKKHKLTGSLLASGEEGG